MDGRLFLLISLSLANYYRVSGLDSNGICSNMTMNIDRLMDTDKRDALKPYYEIAVSFIDAVHLNKPPDPGHIQVAVDYFRNNAHVTFNDVFGAIKPLILDQVVFICLLVIGCLFIILFPLIGLIFCCCRLGGKCGGQKFQENPSDCACISMTLVLIACAGIFVAGLTLYGVNNQRLFQEIKTAPSDFSNQTGQVIDFVDFVSDSVKCSLEESYRKGHDDLVDAAGHVGEQIEAVIMNVSGMEALEEIQIDSDKLNGLISTLNSSLSILCPDGRNLTSQIEAFLSRFRQANINYANVTSPLQRTNELEASCNFKGITLPPLSHNFTKDTDQYVRELHNETTEIQKKINDTLKQLAPTAIDDAISNIDTFLNRSIKSLEDTKKSVDVAVVQVADALSVPWYQYLGLVLIAPIVAITLCILLGLACGLCTYSSSKAPFDRPCVSDCGGCCLMSAAGLMFIFGWLLMALTMVAFVVGYVGESAVCQPVFKNPKHEVWNLLPNITLDSATNTVLNIEEVVQGCKADQPIYQVLKLDAIVKLDQIIQSINNSFTNVLGNLNLSELSASKITYQLQPALRQTLIVLDGIMQNTGQVLRNMTSLSEPIAATNELNSVLSYLEGKTDNASETFRKDATALLNGVTQFTNQIRAVKVSAAEGIKLTDQIHRAILAIPQTNNTALVSQAITNETDQLQKSIRAVIDGIFVSITATVRNSGPCRPLYDIYENVGVLLCHRVLSPLQAFWFSLGWCVVFFIPAVICAIKLAKYFRRMDGQYYGNTVRDSTRWNTNNMEMPVRRAW